MVEDNQHTLYQNPLLIQSSRVFELHILSLVRTTCELVILFIYFLNRCETRHVKVVSPLFYGKFFFFG